MATVIWNWNAEYMTKWKFYEIIDKNPNNYLIIQNDGYHYWHNKESFIKINKKYTNIKWFNFTASRASCPPQAS